MCLVGAADGPVFTLSPFQLRRAALEIRIPSAAAHSGGCVDAQQIIQL